MSMNVDYDPHGPHDSRLNTAWGLLCRREFEAHPERKDATDGMSHFSAFAAGWHYRYEYAASEMLGGDSDPMLTLIRDQFDFMLAEYKRAWRETMRYIGGSRQSTKSQADLAHMLREKKLDPNDAPAWRRISEQRKEIRRLTRENQMLKGQLVEQRGNSQPGGRS